MSVSNTDAALPSSSSASNSPSQPSVTPSPITSPPPPSISRQWRTAAQRNLRNQWSKLASYRQDWVASSSDGRSHANALINAYLSQRYMPMMELGVLKDMPDIRKKACQKLFKQQELHQGKLLLSYQNMVVAVTNMVTAARSMKCFIRGSNSSPLVQFSSDAGDSNDTGDGGGIPVFTFWSISVFENLAQEIVHMFELELGLKRLLVIELVSAACESPQVDKLCWSEELYPGEFRHLAVCHLYSEETNEVLLPRLEGFRSDGPLKRPDHQLNEETSKIYLTAWLAEVNIDTYRVNEIFDEIGEEIHAKIS